jgi:hypothetical protein
MTTYQLQQAATPTITTEDATERLIDRLEAFFTREAARGMVTSRLLGLGTAVTAVFAALGYVLFGPGEQYEFFRDIGPVTALSVSMTFSIGFIGLLIARRETPEGLRRWLNFWFLAGAGFILLSFDAPLDLHGHAGKFIATQTSIATDIGFNATSDAIIAVYLLVGLVVAAINWREMLRHPMVLAYIAIGGVFTAGTIGIDGFGEHSAWMWVLEEWVELLGLAWIVGAFALRLNATRPKVKRPQQSPWRPDVSPP